eukprot:m.65642 g.65642  ORF g.65642 m.65642 type:complete len:63 (+) comp8158_c0_seq4:1835-2023(+)
MSPHNKVHAATGQFLANDKHICNRSAISEYTKHSKKQELSWAIERNQLKITRHKKKTHEEDT